MDTLQETCGCPVKAGQEGIQGVVVGADGGAGFRPGAADALGYGGSDGLAGVGLG